MKFNTLVIGGNRFFGRHLIASLIEKGHNPVLFNRQNIDDGFGSQVERVKGDRDQNEDLKKIAQLKKWDFVFDQVCFNSKQARQTCEVFQNQVGQYILTSTQSVYEMGVNLKEEVFYPQSYEFKQEVNHLQNYSEAKRQMESVFYHQTQFPVTAVRFPIVLGFDDYTKRLLWHFERLRTGKSIYLPNLDAQMGFVDSRDAGRALASLCQIDWKFPLNICSPEPISMRKLMGMIEKKVGKNFKYDLKETNENQSPFGIKQDWFMNVDQMKLLGIQVRPLMQWLPALIEIS